MKTRKPDIYIILAIFLFGGMLITSLVHAEEAGVRSYRAGSQQGCDSIVDDSQCATSGYAGQSLWTIQQDGRSVIDITEFTGEHVDLTFDVSGYQGTLPTSNVQIRNSGPSWLHNGPYQMDNTSYSFVRIKGDHVGLGVGLGVTSNVRSNVQEIDSVLFLDFHHSW